MSNEIRELLEKADIEQISEAVHKAYCSQYEIKHGKPYWTSGDYSKLNDETKEFDRATVRAVLKALLALLEPCGTCGGTEQVGEEQFYQGRSVGWKECPDCQEPDDTSKTAFAITQNVRKTNEQTLQEVNSGIEEPAEKPCKVCGGSKEIKDGETYNSLAGVVIPYKKPCPACQPKDDLGMAEQEFMPAEKPLIEARKNARAIQDKIDNQYKEQAESERKPADHIPDSGKKLEDKLKVAEKEKLKIADYNWESGYEVGKDEGDKKLKSALITADKEITKLEAKLDTAEAKLAFKYTHDTFYRSECERDELKARLKELEDVIQAALRISDLWTLKEVDTMFEDEAKALELMRQGFEQALKGG